MFNDKELLLRASKGDEEAFRMIVEAHKDRVYRALFGVLRSREDALDISQDIFLKLYQRLPKMDPEIHLASWLYRVAVNAGIDQYRKRRREKKVSLDESLPLASKVDPKSQIENKELVEKFIQALSRIGKKHSRILVLREIQGLDYDSIAKVLNCSTGTVMSRLYYARRKVVNVLGDDFL